MSVYEEFAATWEKRFMQKHYSYRDSQSAATVLFLGTDQQIQAQLLALFATQFLTNAPGTVYYPFGYNARNWTTGVAALTNAGIVGSRFAWPQGPQPPLFQEATRDYASGTVGPRGQCYAREVMVYVTEDTWIRFISVNPIIFTLFAQQYSVAQITAMGVPLFITEVEHFVAAGDKDTFYPTYGIAIVFRADSAAGTIYLSIEGNVEGGE